MELSFEQYDNIQKFLDGLMTTSEAAAFEAELAGNESLQDGLEFEKSLRKSLETLADKKLITDAYKYNVQENHSEQEVSDLKALISRVGKKYSEMAGNKGDTPLTKFNVEQTTAPKTILLKNKLWIAAAAVIITAIAILWLMQQKKEPQIVRDTDKNKDTTQIITQDNPKDSAVEKNKVAVIDFKSLFRQYYRKDIIAENPPDYLADALIDYGDDDFHKIQAINIWMLKVRGMPTDSINTEANIKNLGHYYKGISYMETRNPDSAASNLQWVIDNSTDISLVRKAVWYSALLFLQKGEIAKTKKLLQDIIDNKRRDEYTLKAKKLKAQLER